MAPTFCLHFLCVCHLYAGEVCRHVVEHGLDHLGKTNQSWLSGWHINMDHVQGVSAFCQPEMGPQPTKMQCHPQQGTFFCYIEQNPIVLQPFLYCEKGRK